MRARVAICPFIKEGDFAVRRLLLDVVMAYLLPSVSDGFLEFVGLFIRILHLLAELDVIVHEYGDLR